MQTVRELWKQEQEILENKLEFSGLIWYNCVN